MLGAWPAMAMLVHRGDVSSPTTGVYQPMSDLEVFDPDFRSNAPPALGLVAKTGIEFTGAARKKADLDSVVEKQAKGKRLTSTNGEIVLDRGEGFLSVDTPLSQGFTGFGSGKTFTFKNLEVTLKNEYGMVVATALTDDQLSSAATVLITAVANAINTGQEMAPEGNRLKSPGTAPVLVEPLSGKIVLRGLTGDARKTQVWALNPSGVRTAKVSTKSEGDMLSFEMKPSYKCMHYEIVR
jgi:hypothetical protein